MEKNGDHSSFEDSLWRPCSKKTYVYKLMERFRDGREAVENDEGRGRPTISKNVEYVRSLVEEDGRFSVCEIAQAVDISFGSAH